MSSFKRARKQFLRRIGLWSTSAIDFRRTRKRFLRNTRLWSHEKWTDVGNNPYTQMAPLLSKSLLADCRVVSSREASRSPTLSMAQLPPSAWSCRKAKSI